MATHGLVATTQSTDDDIDVVPLQRSFARKDSEILHLAPRRPPVIERSRPEGSARPEI